MIFSDHKNTDPVMPGRNTAVLNTPDGKIAVNFAASLDFELFASAFAQNDSTKSNLDV